MEVPGTPLRILIVDDEAPARDELRYLLETIGDVIICGEANCAEEGVNLAREHEPDLVFLDIMMEDMDGLSAAREILAGDRQTLIVFATAYNQYAIEAFEIHAVDYVLKPFSQERVAATLRRARQVLREKTAARSLTAGMETLLDGGWNCDRKRDRQLNRIPAYTRHRMYLLEPDEVLYCYAEAGDVFIVAKQDKYKASMSLRELEIRLGDDYFYRTHRSFLVNLAKVQQIIPWFKGTYKLVVQGGVEVPVSRVFVRGLKEALNIQDCRFGTFRE